MREFRSEIVPRYQRRTREMDETILGAYLAGANTRRIRKALEAWPEAQLRRCTLHKWCSLEQCCPAHARRELKRDYHGIVYAKSLLCHSQGHRGIGGTIASSSSTSPT